MALLWVLVGAAVAGPVCAALTLWATRRAWRSARRLSARTKGHEQLVELGQLAGGLAHEIKNPLSTINVNLKLLAEDLRAARGENERRWLRRITSVQVEADRLKGIVDDFLRYAGKYELNLATVDVRRLVDEVVEFFGPQAEAARVVMRAQLPEGEVRCRVDPNLLKQALLNLMLNAVDAMSDGGELLVRLAGQRGRALLEVIDTGTGIPPDQLPRIFEVYYSTKKTGTGLGLPTTRRIVREHAGTLHVDSEPGKGTRFTIALPLDRA